MADNRKLWGRPNEIWLQRGDDGDCQTFSQMMQNHGLDVTWSQEPVHDNDIGPFVLKEE